MVKQKGEESVDLIPMALPVNSSANTAVVASSAASGQ